MMLSLARRVGACGVLAGAGLLAGCGGGDATTADAPVVDESAVVATEVAEAETLPPEQPRESLPADEVVTAAAADAVTLELAPWEDVQRLIESHQGKVVVVDLWATYCVPCREEFPGLVELSHADPENIACISVSLDDPDSHERALAFLQEQNATMQNVLCTTDSDQLYDEILQIGGIPAVYVYGRDGELAKLFTGPTEEGTDHTYEGHIRPFVTELAAAQ